MSADIIRSEKRTFFRERTSFEEKGNVQGQIASMLSPQMEATVFIILQIFFAARAFLKIGEYHSDIPQLAGEYSVM